MWVGVVTLFPEMFSCITDYGVVGRAVRKQLLELHMWNPRDFATDVHRTVDDKPYGGGPGMVMKVAPLAGAINAAKEAAGTNNVKVIGLSPAGQRVNQDDITELIQQSHVIFVPGRYEGIDERLYTLAIDAKWSIGDYVLSGGELAAMVLIDAATRLIPGVLGHAESAQKDSFVNGLLDYPAYTRPEEISGLQVPKVLLSGDHSAIAKWRLQEQHRRTKLQRPDLYKQEEGGDNG